MSLPSDVVGPFGPNAFNAIDGAFAAPVGAHTYDNNIYLPFIDRLLVLGGSPWNTAWPFMVPTGPDTARITGPYTFDPAKADGNRVGGTTGSHVKKFGPYPEIIGGMMWQNRDLYAFLPQATLPVNFAGGTTAYAGSSGKDVVFLSAGRNVYSTQQTLFQYELTDPDDSLSDRMSIVGVFGSGLSGRGAGAYDPDLNAFVRTAKSSPRYDVLDGRFGYWNLATPGAGNKNVTFTPTDLSGSWKLDRGFGLDYDPIRRQYLLWGGDELVWVLKPPASLSAAGWTIELAPPSPTVGPVYPYAGYTQEPGGGVLGKWKYIPELDVFMGLENPAQGNVWLYKPIGWTRPGTTPPPTVTLAAEPSAVSAGETAVLSWTTTNAASCEASDGWVGPRAGSGTQIIGPFAAATKFTLVCTGPGGQVSRSVTVQIVPAMTLSANPLRVIKSGSTQLSWSAPWATSCQASGGWTGTRPPVGSETSAPISSNTTFSLTCSGQDGSATKMVAVSVETPPKITLGATPESLATGQTALLQWSVVGATSCQASRGWSGLRPTAGSETVGPLATSTRFDLTCSGPGGTSTGQLLISRTW